MSLVLREGALVCCQSVLQFCSVVRVLSGNFSRKAVVLLFRRAIGTEQMAIDSLNTDCLKIRMQITQVTTAAVHVDLLFNL